jgi:sporulation protein YlmC with PRC-barrel domain
MRFRDADLRGIPVQTKSGQKVGKLKAFVIDAEHHEVSQYVVAKAGTLLSKIMPDEFLVHRSQVVSMDGDRMIILDAAVTEAAEVVRRMTEHVAEPASHGASSMKS